MTDKRQPHVEVYKGRGPQPWRWRARAANGEITVTGEGYTRRASALRAARKLGLPIKDLATA